MDRSRAVFVWALLVVWFASVFLFGGGTEPITQPIDFNHMTHVKRVDCRECHFICEKNRDEDGEIDCDDCSELETNTPFCEEHAICPDHKLPGLPGIRDCLRCHEDDLLDLRETPESDDEPGDHRKRVLLDYVTFDEADEVTEVTPIPWNRVTSLPLSGVYFSHRTHAIVGEIDCATCHGQVSQWDRPPAKMEVELNMTLCIDCHHQDNVTENCASCHR